MTPRQKILTACAIKGVSMKELMWEPISTGYEMYGPNGGWQLWIDTDKTPVKHFGNPLLAYNSDELVAKIEKLDI